MLRKLLYILLYVIPMLFVRMVIPTLAIVFAWNLLSSGDVRISYPPTGGEVFVLAFVSGLVFFWLPIAALVMEFATPKAVVARYLAPPHFSNAEVAVFGVTNPWVSFETIIFMAACTFPRHWLKGRKMTAFRDRVPRWYVWSSRLVLSGLFLHLAVLIGLSVWLAVLMVFDRTDTVRRPVDWDSDITVAAVVALACFVLFWIERRRRRHIRRDGDTKRERSSGRKKRNPA